MTLFSALAAILVLFDYAYRFSNVFIDNVVFNGFSFLLFILMIVNAVTMFILSALRMKHLNIYYKKGFRAVSIISFVYMIFSIALIIGQFIIGGDENLQLFSLMCLEAFPVWAAVTGILYLLIIVPNMSSAREKKFVSVVTTACLVFVTYISLFPITPYKFTSGPAVFDNGQEYSVVFSTNDKGTAYLSYEYNGKSVTIYDENNGRKYGDSRIHTISVPYEQLSGNTYTVGSTRVIDELSYGGRSGKTIVSEPIKFNDNLGDNINLLTISDWHTHLKLAKRSVSYLGEYNAILLLGDAAPGLMFPKEVETNIVEFAGDLSGGTMPILFARGNHETRGKEAVNLAGYLGMDKFYYMTSLGNYNFIVLDSGEDKEDSHPEYGGMVAYEQNRENMVDWLETLENADNKKTIAVSHSDEICIEKDLSDTAYKKLDSLNSSILLSGHHHSTEYKTDKEFPVLVDGGSNANGSGTFVASMVNLSQSGIDIKCVDSNGKVILTETAEWK